MARRRLALLGVGLVVMVMAAVLTSVAGLVGTNQEAVAQAPAGDSNMQDRLNQIIGILQSDPDPLAADAAAEHALEVLYGGLRPLPTPDVPETEQADDIISQAERSLAVALEDFVRNGGANGPKDKALDLKLFIEQMNEVAAAVGEITRQCGLGDSLNDGPCSELQPLLDEDDGEVRAPARIREGFEVKLRSPFVPPWFGTDGWHEDVVVTEPIGNRECAVVFKETIGLTIRLKLQRITVVRDPWVSTFGVPRGTKVPVWTLEWVPTEYVKEWNICNQNGTIRKDVTQRVVQDVPLNFFWRYYANKH